MFFEMDHVPSWDKCGFHPLKRALAKVVGMCSDAAVTSTKARQCSITVQQHSQQFSASIFADCQQLLPNSVHTNVRAMVYPP